MGNVMTRLLATGIMVSSFWVTADSVTISSGSTIKGKIKRIHEGKMVLSTDFSEDVVINMDKVKEFKTDADVKIKTLDDQKLIGSVASDGKAVSVSTEQSTSSLKENSVRMLWLPGEKAPDFVAPFKKEWEFVASGDWVKKTGNTDEDSLSAEFKGILEGLDDTLKIYLRYQWKKSNNQGVEDERLGGFDYEKRFGERSSSYVRGELEKDKFEGIDLRSTVAFGYGYYFCKRDNLKLRGRIGAFYRNESFADETDSTDTYGVDLGLRFDYTRPDKLGWYTDINYTPSIEQFSEYRVTHESAMSVPVGDTDWFVKLGLRHEYNTEAPDDKDNLDTTYFSRVELHF